MTLADENCARAQEGAEPAPEADQAAWMKELPAWERQPQEDVPTLFRGFPFENFSEGLEFARHIAAEAERQNHHPRITLDLGSVGVRWWSHKLHGLHKNDFIMAAKTDRLYAQRTDRRQARPASDAPA